MGKERRGSRCAVFVRGGVVSVCVYLAILVVLSLLVVNGVIPEKAGVGLVACAGFVAALVGGLTVVGVVPLGRLPAAMINTAIFIGVLVVVKLVGGTPVLWEKSGWLLLGCIFAGGAMSGLLKTGKKRRGRRGGARVASKGRS